MMENVKLFRIWLRFKRWMRSLFIAMGKGLPINWPGKITEVTEILDDALDVREQQTRISGTGVVPKQDQQKTLNKEEHQAKKERKRLRRFLRRKHGD